MTQADHDNEGPCDVPRLVQSIMQQRAELRIALSSVERLARAEGQAALVQRVAGLATAVRQQFNLLDAVLEIVMVDDAADARAS